MSVKVREKRGKLYLDVYQGAGKRRWESLHLALTGDRAQNREVWRTAEVLRSQREINIAAGVWDITIPRASKILLTDYLEHITRHYKRKDTITACVSHIANYDKTIQLGQITSGWVEGFQYSLFNNETLKMNSALYYSDRVKMGLRKAYREGLVAKDLTLKMLKIAFTEPDLQPLTEDEVKRLAAVVFDDPFAAEVRRAFLFACCTGLRIIDLESLTWSMIKVSAMQLVKTQVKTGKKVCIPLGQSARALIIDGREHAPDERVFNFLGRNRRVSYTQLTRWACAAGVETKLGWHTARRTFATLALESGADSSIIAKLLGHSGLSSVGRYAKVTDKARRNAVEAMPPLF